MRQRLSVYVIVGVAATALLGVPVASAQGVSPWAIHGAVWKAHLTGGGAYPAVRGSVRLYEAFHPMQRTISVRLWRARNLSNWLLTVYEGGRFVGHMLVRSDGTASLDHDTNKGQVVPAVRRGHYSVRVRTRRGHLVASGKLYLASWG
jgi:hypothetical protein